MKKQLFASWIFMLIVGYVHAQQALNIQQSLRDYLSHDYQPRLLIQTDREVYLAGETIWLQLLPAMVSQADIQDLSKIVYVEILDAQHKPVFQEKIGMKNGTAAGYLQLPTDLSTGNYTICAYTNWMKNFGEDCFFRKQIVLINSFQPLPAISKTPDPLRAFRFVPNHHELVVGLETTLAYGVKGDLWQSPLFKGYILSDKNDTIAILKPNLYGINAFKFTPEKNRKYFARITYPLDSVILLPPVKDHGSVFHLKKDSSILTATLLSADALPIADYHLVLVNNGALLLSQSNKPIGNKLDFQIQHQKLHPGVNELTILDKDFKVVNQQFYYVQPEPNAAKISAKLAKTIFQKREKVTVNLETKDTLSSNFMVTAIKTDKLSGWDRSSSTLLQSHFNAEAPILWNRNLSGASVSDMNTMLALYGKATIPWEKVFEKNPALFKFPPEINGLLIKGKVLSKAGQPMPNIPIFITIPGKNVRLYTLESDQDGNIDLEIPLLSGNMDLIVQPSVQDSTLKIEIYSPFYTHQLADQERMPKLRIDPDLMADIKQRHKTLQLQEAYYLDSLNQALDVAPIDTIPFFGKAEDQFNLDDYTRFTTMEEVFREYVPHVMVRKQQDGLHLFTLNKGLIVPKFFEVDPFVMLDGVPVFNFNKFFNFDPLKVKKGAVVARNYFYNQLKVSGIVSLQTYKGDLDGYPLESYVTVHAFHGIQLSRTPFSPKQAINRRLPDQRSLIYYAPNVSLNKGLGTLDFYTSDVPGNYKISIQNLSPGNPVNTTLEIKVE